MPATAQKFEQLARPVSHAEDGRQWHGPVTSLQLGGGEFQLWCEMPRLDPQLDATAWLVLPDCPGMGPELGRVAHLRRTDSPWWSFDLAGAAASDWASLQDIDLQRQVDDIRQLADWLGLRQFHVMAGGFSSVLAVALAAQMPERVASLVLDSVFMPVRPMVGAYLRNLHRTDPRAYEQAFGRTFEPQDFGAHLLAMDVREAVTACQIWVDLECRLGKTPPGRDEGTVIRSRRLLAHLMSHDFFISPDQWMADIQTLINRCIPVTVVQGLGDGVCQPSGARFFTDMLPQACLVELPDVGHGAACSQRQSALASAVIDHRRPRARLIPWPTGTRPVRPVGGV